MNEKESEGFEKHLKIDKYSLDTELMEQADLFHTIASEYANAVSRKDAAYESMKEAFSEASNRIRKEAEDDGRKVTEKIIENEAKVDKTYTETVNEWLYAKTDADRFQVMKDAFEQRSRMMTRLVELYISGYFMDSTVKGSKQEADELQYESNKSKMRKARGG